MGVKRSLNKGNEKIARYRCPRVFGMEYLSGFKKRMGEIFGTVFSHPIEELKALRGVI